MSDTDPTTTKRRPSRGGNGNERGNAVTRMARRLWMLEAYRANADALVLRANPTEAWPMGEVLAVATADPRHHGTAERPVPANLAPGWTVEKAARCYRCGDLLVDGTLTVDRIFPGKVGGRYGSPTQDRRELRTNVRPACLGDNSSTGAILASRSQKSRE